MRIRTFVKRFAVKFICVIVALALAVLVGAYMAILVFLGYNDDDF